MPDPKGRNKDYFGYTDDEEVVLITDGTEDDLEEQEENQNEQGRL